MADGMKYEVYRYLNDDPAFPVIKGLPLPPVMQGRSRARVSPEPDEFEEDMIYVLSSRGYVPGRYALREEDGFRYPFDQLQAGETLITPRCFEKQMKQELAAFMNRVRSKVQHFASWEDALKDPCDTTRLAFRFFYPFIGVWRIERSEDPRA